MWGMDQEIQSWLSGLPEKHPLDKTKYRRFVLDNGLKVILASDPTVNKSGASMAVEVGSLSDPKDIQGLAHFLEHMLFLGTEKYPDVDDYGKYLKSNGGYSNAYTSRMITNYHFEIYPDALEGALDRFSQFFISPLFSEKFTEREMNAVESEFQKNLQNDGWRTLQIRRSMYKEGHPENHFSIGNLSTLSHVTREQLLEFYNSYYTPERMNLSIVSSDSLDVLENWVREYFEPIAPKENSQNIRIDPVYLEEKDAVRIAWIEPVKDQRTMQLEFSLPAIHDQWKSKPVDILAYALGDEGPGSLLSFLKKKGYATTLGAFAHDETGLYGRLMISISLTEKGLKEYEAVLEYIYSYIDMLKKHGYDKRLFKELAIQARLDEVYNDKGEGSERAVFLANQLSQFPLEIAEREPYLFLELNEAAYMDFLSYLRPENMIVLISAKGVDTDYTEPYYGTSYRIDNRSDGFFEKLQKPKAIEDLYFPPKNPFIPERVELEPERVVKLIDEKGVELYYSQDHEFKRPKMTLIVDIYQPKKYQSKKYEVLKSFLTACIQESLNEIAYPASIAGLHYDFTADTHKTRITISGYSESAKALLKRILDTIYAFDLPAEQFAGIKDRIVKNLKNFDKKDAWMITRLLKNQIVEEVLYHPNELVKYTEKVDLKEVQNFAKKLMRRGAIQALIHGNINDIEAIGAIRNIQTSLNLKPLEKSKTSQQRYLVENESEDIVRVSKLQVNNSCFWREYNLGDDDPETRAISLIFNNFIKQPFYTEMRTNKQLGYIVWGGCGRKDRNLFSYYVIQSATHTPDELQEYVNEFITRIPSKFSKLDDDEFEKIRDGAIALMEEKPKTIAEKAVYLSETVYHLDANFHRKSETIGALRSITKSQVLEKIEKWFMKNPNSRTTLSYAENHPVPDTIQVTFEDLDEWKKTREYK